MTDDQRKKYEEAAKEYAEAESFTHDGYVFSEKGFLAGCTFASQDTEERVKQAHNEAIEKAIELINRCPSHFYSDNDYRQVTEEIQKLKL